MHSPQLNDLQLQVNRKLSQESKKLSGMTADNNLISLNNNGTSRQTQALLKQYQQVQFCQQNGEYNVLESPEISLNLHSLIEETHFSEGLLLDIANYQGKSNQSLTTRLGTGQYNNSNHVSRPLAYMPQPVHSSAAYSPRQNSTNSDSESSFCSDMTSIKEEPQDPDYFNSMSNTRLPLTNSGGVFSIISSGQIPNALNTTHSQGITKKAAKLCDKDSDEYRRKRMRNNMAVRKSREKANQRRREIEEKNRMLLKENEKLNKQLESLTEELNMLRTLVTSFGNSPGQLSREFGKHLDSFQLQQQHL